MARGLTVIIPWRDRPELAETLGNNAPVFRAHGLAITIVNCGGNPDELEAIVERSRTDALLVHIRNVRFNVSLARNLGLNYSPSDYVFMLDADVIVSDKTISQC